jgi:hypothetical protein
MGMCLTESHKLLGEGFPEPLEGPQESYNANLNQRKDNVALALNSGAIVSRYGNVDLESLVNSRPGAVTLADDVNAVVQRQIPDATQGSYMEASADMAMMEEMSGITSGKVGMESSDKATVAQINYSESNAKIDLFVAIVAETFIKDLYTGLAWLIQKFETDDRIFRIANKRLREETGKNASFIYDMDFEADCIINIGNGTTGRQLEINQILTAMDRAIMANQSMIQLMQTGAQPATGAYFINTMAFMEDLLPKIGQKDLKKYFIPLTPPTQQATGSGGNAGQAMSGRTQPQIGANAIPMVQNGAQGTLQ